MTLTPTHYSTLHLPSSASPPSIRKAYKSLALTSHPDNTRHLSATSRAAHARLFRKVQEAYDVLSESGRKRAYDNELDAHGGVVEGRRSTFHAVGSPSGEISIATSMRTRMNIVTSMVGGSSARSELRTDTCTSTRTSPTHRPRSTATERQCATREAEREIRRLLDRRAERKKECGMEVWELEVRLRVWRDMCGGFAGDGEVRAYCEGRVERLEDCVGQRGKEEEEVFLGTT